MVGTKFGKDVSIGFADIFFALNYAFFGGIALSPECPFFGPGPGLPDITRVFYSDVQPLFQVIFHRNMYIIYTHIYIYIHTHPPKLTYHLPGGCFRCYVGLRYSKSDFHHRSFVFSPRAGLGYLFSIKFSRSGGSGMHGNVFP